MMKTILFDLDGTLLPMDQELFIKAYFKRLAARLAPHGYDPEKLFSAIWEGMADMIRNDGSILNEDAFWNSFCKKFGDHVLADKPIFDDFYHNEFQQVSESCGFAPEAAEVIALCKQLGMRLILATNPIFPAVATLSRIRWAGLNKDDFELITTYENSSSCKPNPAYYQEIIRKQQLDPAECLMVGNDVGEDMVAGKLGMKVFLLTDCLINKKNEDIDQYPHGSFAELKAYIKAFAQ